MTDAGRARPADLVERLLELLPRGGDQPVVTDLEQTWTLSEVAAQAAAIAKQLSSGPRGPVAVLVNRSVHSVAAMFAPAWVGRALVALDVTDAPDRIEGILERVGASTLLDSSGLAPDVFAGRPVERPAVPLVHREEWPEVRLVDPDATALVSFTSGSTGRPKGIRKTFAQARVNDGLYAATPGFLAMERVGAFMPLHFKGGFAPIIHGVARGRFTALVDLGKWSPDEIVARLELLRIERLSITPSALRTLLRSVTGADRVASLRSVWCVGEPLMWSDVELVRQRIHPGVRVTTGYGASEALGFRLLFTAEPDVAIGEGRVPLGLPVHEGGVHIEPLEGDSQGRGELLYRGNLTDGYFDEPDLGKERFITDPVDGMRLWRSGDVVSIDSDGVFHLSGRIDDMVKINGKLVEPAESETFLRSLPGVRDATVVVRRRPSGRVQLVAHLVTDESLSVAGVFEALRVALPAHIRPSVLVRHHALPRTDRGKADRQLLANSEFPRWTDTRRTHERDPLIAAVVGVARELLDLDDIGADETLRDLGMDSLATLELVALLDERGLGEIDPSLMVTLDTCEDIAEQLRARRSRRRKWSPTTIHADGTRPPLFFVVGGGDLGLRIQSLVAALGPEQPIVVLEQHGLSAGWRPDRTVQAAARRFLRVVERQQPSGEVLLAGHSYGGLVAHAMAERLEHGGRRARLVLLDTAPGASREMIYPDALRSGNGPSFVRTLKRVKWWAVRRLRLWRGLTRATASRERHDSFFVRSIDAAIRYRPSVLGVPTTYLCADGGDPDAWAGHPSSTTVRVPGDHLTMLDPPNVIEVAAALTNALGPS